MIDRVSKLLEEAAAALVLPRFRRLQGGDVAEKSPGEVVTIVDREVEARLSPALMALRPGSTVVGEEACADDPTLLGGLSTGDVWLVDPLDGTANFVAGNPCFSIMVALLRDGVATASWMYSPAHGTLHVAERGGGAFAGGERIGPTAAPPLREARGAVFTRFLPRLLCKAIEGRQGCIGDLLPGLLCAGEEYPAIATGRRNFALFWRTLPWDHAPGALFLEEAGGKVARFDGEPYRPHMAGEGLLAAQTAELWADLRSGLLGQPG